VISSFVPLISGCSAFCLICAYNHHSARLLRVQE
jgi:hypothetical protein